MSYSDGKPLSVVTLAAVTSDTNHYRGYCRTESFYEHNLCILVCDVILRKCIFGFLLLVYRQSIERRSICMLNFYDRPENFFIRFIH